MQAVFRSVRPVAFGSCWLALIILTGAAGAAPLADTQVASAGDGPQLDKASAVTVVQASRPSPVDGVSRALEERLHRMVPGGSASDGASTGR